MHDLIENTSEKRENCHEKYSVARFEDMLGTGSQITCEVKICIEYKGTCFFESFCK